LKYYTRLHIDFDKNTAIITMSKFLYFNL